MEDSAVLYNIPIFGMISWSVGKLIRKNVIWVIHRYWYGIATTAPKLASFGASTVKEGIEKVY